MKKLIERQMVTILARGQKIAGCRPRNRIGASSAPSNQHGQNLPVALVNCLPVALVNR